MKRKTWLWAFAVLPLACLPLVAQEPKAEDSAEPVAGQATAPAEPPAEAPADTKPEAAARQPDPPEERVSADNNLSFPVDI